MNEHTVFGFIGGSVLAAVIGVLNLLRRASRDKVEIAKDRAESDIIDLLRQQREESQNEVKVLRKDLELLAEENEESIERLRDLTAQNTQLRSQVRLLNILVTRLTNGDVILPQISGDTGSKSP